MNKVINSELERLERSSINQSNKLIKFTLSANLYQELTLRGQGFQHLVWPFSVY